MVQRVSDLFPIAALVKKCPHAKRRAPIKILVRVVAIAERSRYGNNSLMSVIGQRDKHMNHARLVLRMRIVAQEYGCKEKRNTLGSAFHWSPITGTGRRLTALIRQIPSSSFCLSAFRAAACRPAGRQCRLFPSSQSNAPHGHTQSASASAALKSKRAPSRSKCAPHPGKIGRAHV